jgi:hypothetical protein
MEAQNMPLDAAESRMKAAAAAAGLTLTPHMCALLSSAYKGEQIIKVTTSDDDVRLVWEGKPYISFKGLENNHKVQKWLTHELEWTFELGQKDVKYSAVRPDFYQIAKRIIVDMLRYVDDN